MDFDPVSLSHDLLLDISIEHINESSRFRRYMITISGICFILFLIFLSLSLVFIVTNKQQLWPITTTTSTSLTSNVLKTTSK